MANGSFEYYGMPPSPKGLEYRLEAIATASQTVFTSPYTIGMLDVYVDGLLLPSTAYTATNGTSITLNTPCTIGQVVKMISRSTALVTAYATYSQAQSDAKYATITNLALKADITLVNKRGLMYFMGNF